VDASARYTFRRALASDTVFAGYSLTYLDNLGILVNAGDLDPNEPAPRLPERGLLAQLRTGWAYSTVRRFVYDISPSEGAFLSVGVSAADPLIGSQFRNVTLTWTGQTYLRNPLWRLHVLALRYAGGVSEGDLGRRGVFGVGGFPQVSIVDQLTQQIFLGGAVMRGYPPNVRVGTQYHLAQVEYRFPLFRPQVGVSTLPFYVNRLYAGVFADVGDAFTGRLRDAEWRLGTGAELLIDFTLGYFLAFTLRVGIARGWMDGGETQGYLNLGTPY
jgi:outer membrane translocation and assembly module TamA